MGSFHGGGFEVDGAAVVDCGVSAGRVAERFEPAEHRPGEPGAGGPSEPVEEFALKWRDEALGGGIVERVADGALRSEQASAVNSLAGNPGSVV